MRAFLIDDEPLALRRDVLRGAHVSQAALDSQLVDYVAAIFTVEERETAVG